MNTSVITVSKNKKLVKANSENSAFQLYNESVIPSDTKKPIKIDTWYPITHYGEWVLENEFPNTKGDEFIDVKYE